MELASWMIFGAIVGWVLSIFFRITELSAIITTIGIGILGAIMGGWLMSMAIGPSPEGLNLYSLLVATIGSILIILCVKPRNTNT